MTKNSFYVTTAIDYASGNPHIGHAYEKITADVIARWNKCIGKSVFYQTGTDEHGQKIFDKAKESNLEVKKFVDNEAKKFQDLCKKVNSEYDFFLRTTDVEHKKLVQEILQKVYDKGDIYKDTYKGLYCVGCERYYGVDELIDGKICPDHKKEVKEVEEENYFFKLSKYEKPLLELYKKNPNFISPKSRAKEIINRVKDGLQDISISRRKETLSWGIEFPFDKEHVTYVWFDALFNYYTGLKINKKEEFWPCNSHIIGADISWFHVVYWPAFLLSYGLELPKSIRIHGMILDGEGHKMSKSLGNVIDPIEQINKFGVDEFRFYITTLGTYGEDLSYSEESFIDKINNDLNNDLGNLVSRVHAMTGKYFEGKISKIDNLTKADEEFISKLNIYDEFNREMQDFRFNQAIEILWTIIRETNAYVNACAPWKESDEKRLATVMNILCSSVVYFAKYLECFMPEKSSRIFKQYNVKNDNIFKLEFLEKGHKLGEKDNIFEKVKVEKKEEVKELPKFAKLGLTVGKIIEIKEHPEADKLFIEKIDIGEKEPRQIVSGLRNYYTKEEMLGKKVIVVSNLKPAELRGTISQGMILAAEKEGKVGLVTTDVEIGTNLEWKGFKANSKEEITVDEFFKVKMKSDGKAIYHQGEKIKVNSKNLSIDKNIEGKIR